MKSVEIFISYAPEDEDLRKKLVTHLSSLNRQGLANVWHDQKIAPGFQKQVEIDLHLNTAQIILLLVSADFLASDYCYSSEYPASLDKSINQKSSSPTSKKSPGRDMILSTKRSYVAIFMLTSHSPRAFKERGS